MPLIPGRRLLWLLAVPIALSVAAVLESSLIAPLLLLDAAIAALVLFDALLVARASVSVERTAPSTLSLTRPVTVDLAVHNRAGRTLSVSLTDELFATADAEGLPATMEISAGVVRHTSYRLKAMQRGLQTIGDHFVRYGSPMGLWTRQLRLPGHTELRVYPDVQAVRHYDMLARQNRDAFASRRTRLRGGDTEFERLRDYLPDDDYRRVDWKATARRRKLTVREYELERNQNVVFVLDCGRTMTAVWDGLSALDYALNATLMLSHVAIRRGDQVGLIAFDDQVRRIVKPRTGISASNRIIQSTYDLFPKMVEPDYEAAFHTLRTQITKRTLVVFISHALDDATAKLLQRLTRELLPKHLPLCVLLRDREVEARATSTARTAEQVCVQAAAANVLAWRDRVHAEMRRAGVLVLDVLHRQLTGELVSRYLEVKARGLI